MVSLSSQALVLALLLGDLGKPHFTYLTFLVFEMGGKDHMPYLPAP